MPLQTPTRDFLKFLAKNPAIRAQIRASPDKTLLYAGRFFKPIWKEIADLKRTSRQLADKEILPDVLSRIPVHGQPFRNLLEWAQHLDSVQPWLENGFIVWRALSGIFASNAVGAVSFSIGSGVTKTDKVFAATELSVLARNPNVDSTTKAMLEYYKRCIQTHSADINVGFTAG